jgi:hypothetical protein
LPGRRRLSAVMLFKACPCEVLPWRGPKPPPGTPRLPVRAGRQEIARLASQGHDAFGLDAGDCGRPGRIVRTHVRGELVETERVLRYEGAVVELLGDDHVHHAQGQCRIRARTDHEHLMRALGRLGVAHVDGDDLGAAALGGDDMARRVRLAGQVGAPEHDLRRVLPHIFLGIGLQNAAEAHAKGAEPPADHDAAPGLAAVQISEALDELPADACAVVGARHPVAGPQPHPLASGSLHALHDAIECLVPAHSAPGVRGAAVAHQRMEQPLGIVDDLTRGLPAHAQKTLAVRVVFVAHHSHQAPMLDFDQHATQSRMTAHRTHGADDTRLACTHSSSPGQHETANNTGTLWSHRITCFFRVQSPTPAADRAGPARR